MRTFKEMARLLEAKLSDPELTELEEMMDGDRDHELLEALAEIVSKKHPELFSSPKDPKML